MKTFRRQYFTRAIIFVSASSFVRPIRRSSSLTLIELHLTSLFIEMNIIAPPKSCINSLPVEMSSKLPYFYCALKDCLGSPLLDWLLLYMEKNCSQSRDSKQISKQLSQSMSIRERPEDRFWTNLTNLSATNSLDDVACQMYVQHLLVMAK